MKIEIAKAERMSQSGSSLLRLIQNNNMPILDLFVRESVQNSLDAGIDGMDYVNLQFLTGTFDSEAFSQELEGVSEKLQDRYGNEENRFLAVRDSNTCGLTGPMNYDSIVDNKYGNLLKLVYEISKPQEKEGAGGSWGLGKTVYFRVGMGLVIYYSRIKTESGYESRMAVTLVENETSDYVLIPPENNGLSRGIAWWGRETGENKTEPLTDEAEIQKVLDEFGISLYSGEETGTTIIIPYIDENALLTNNEVVYEAEDGNGQYIPVWRKSVEAYLAVALQRWYSPRMNNPVYPYGKYLRARINDRNISYDEMEPFFRVIQSLYNRANCNVTDFDCLKDNEENTDTEEIRLRNIFVDTNAGTLAYTQISRDGLGMGYPDNHPSPYVYTNVEMGKRDGNAPIICFTRKPGMIVSYENTGKWADGIPSAMDQDHYIIAIFVLNTLQKFRDLENYTLEEYVRKSEMADHTNWNDWSIDAYNPRIINKIQGQISKKMVEEFGAVNEDTGTKQNSGLGKLFGDMLLPPQNFGKKAGASGSGNGGNTTIASHRSVTLSIKSKDTKYFSDGTMRIKLVLKGKENMKSAEIMLGIDSESGIIKTAYWEKQMGLTLPFYIQQAYVTFADEKNKYNPSRQKTLTPLNSRVVDGGFGAELILSDGKGTGVKITGTGKDRVNAEIVLTMRLKNREVLSTFYLGNLEEQ